MKIFGLLEKFGLTKKETALYLAAVELGSASVQRIAARAGIVRSTAYEVLEVLRERGLVASFLKKKTLYYSAEDPVQVVRWAERRVDALKEALPELNILTGRSRQRPSVRFYEGKEGATLILREILDEARELIGFASVDDVFRQIDRFDLFTEERIKRKIPIRVIMRDSPRAHERQQLGPQQLREVKIVPVHPIFHGMLLIWKNKVALFSYMRDYVVVVIESAEIAELQRALFNNVWDILP